MLSWLSFGQQIPTSSGNNAQAGRTDKKFWSRGGNTNTSPNGMNNIFGTLWNSPIYTKTYDEFRTKLNGNLTAQYFINGYNTMHGYFLQKEEEQDQLPKEGQI